MSVGRGIGSQDNLDDVQELADALGAPLSASRPVTDAGWLPKTRQVGKSGLKVKPKVYLTFGISGAPEHLEGMRDAELIIACNTDPNSLDVLIEFSVRRSSCCCGLAIRLPRRRAIVRRFGCLTLRRALPTLRRFN